MSQNIRIKQGLDIKLTGEPDRTINDGFSGDTIAIKPTDLPGLLLKLEVKEGDEVLAGTPVFHDKNNDNIKICSPVSGEVTSIVRGEKRKILEARILSDKTTQFVVFSKADPLQLAREDIIQQILVSGIWPLIRQRPFGIVAQPSQIPKSIFISAFDTNPLAPDYGFLLGHSIDEFQVGLNALSRLTTGIVHLNVHERSGATVFQNLKNVTINTFSGPHPSGNVGIQIHHLDPVNKGEVVWCLNPQDVLIIGKLFLYGRFDASKIVAVTGSHVQKPQYYKTVLGTAVKDMLAHAGLKDGTVRIISGNVLTGKKIEGDGYLGFYDSQLTVIPEGNEPEFMGWLAPGLHKLSMSRTFFSWLMPSRTFNVDTNLHGEERPFVVTGEYEKVFPMDIYPVQLLKSVLIQDLESMENLGIYEVVEEDFALCEFVCTSKIECQKIIRKGIELVRRELS